MGETIPVKILLICHRFPYPPKDGAKIRPFYMIRHWKELGHHVTVASMVRNDEEEAEAPGLRDYADEVIQERVIAPVATLRMALRLPRSEPSSMGYFYSRRLHQRIKDATAQTKFDLIFVFCSSVAQYVSHVTDVPKMLDFGDMDSQKWLSYGTFKPFPLSLGYFVEGLKLQFAEAELARTFDLNLATTPAEIKTLEGYLTGCKTAWFVNGVDADKFSPSSEPYDSDTIAFIGRMNYYPNGKAMIDFCREVLPLVQAERPGAKMVIVGADPTPDVLELGRLPGVTVTGSVDAVQPYIHKAALTVAPLTIARGTQNKVLESLAMGVPAVCSPLAAGGVDAVPEEHLLVADRPRRWADQILRLLSDPETRRRFSEAGRARMISHHDWEKSLAKLDGLMEQTIRDFASRRSPR